MATPQTACTGKDPELWFPLSETSPAAIEQTVMAQAICGGCRVREGCLNWAIEHDIRDGIWGGLTERERAALIRRYDTPRRKHEHPIVEGRRAELQEAMASVA